VSRLELPVFRGNRSVLRRFCGVHRESLDCRSGKKRVLQGVRILFFCEDSRLVRRAALKHHSARHGLGSKTVEQELTERTEVLR
jgi:hypothetical protein